MRKSLAMAAFLAVGGGAVSAAAATLPHFLGSDTLFQVTTQAITACSGAAGLIYDGTGSGNGESAMVKSTQAIAPMSRFMNNNICSATGGLSTLQSSQGLVIGLDGVSVLMSTLQGAAGAGACNGTNSTTCTPEVTGLAFSTSVTTTSSHLPSYTYTFANWKDVLAVLYGGMSNASQNTATGDSGCNSDIRNTLANGWGKLFQNPSCGPAGTCTALQHAFRRDDGSGTSDVFQQLIGISPSPTSASNRSFGTSPYCNVNEVGVKAATAANPIKITTTIPHGLTSGQTVTIVGVGKNIDNTPITGATPGNVAANGNSLTVTVIDGLNFTVAKDGTVAGNGTAVGSYAMVLLPPPAGLLSDPIATDYREQDPIRRTCVGAVVPREDVCNRDGMLGLVLPIVPTDFLGSTAAQYPTTACSAVDFSVPAAVVRDPNTGLNKQITCPNGDPIHGGNLCVMPVDASGNTNCLNPPTNRPFAFDPTAVNGIAPGAADARVYNSHLITGPAATSTYQLDTFSRPIIGAWYRIHSLHTIATGATATACQQVDATLQIGCLVQASPCSVGFAGRTADAWDSTSTSPGKTTAMKINQVLPLTACVQSFSYSLSRKLYLDSVVGWPNVAATDVTWGPKELALAQCEATGTTITPILTGLNFIPLASGAPNSGNPFAEDFDEPMVCPTQAPPATNANSIAFTGNASVSMPTVGTVCGNGVLEPYEDCDDGTTGAVNPPALASAVPVNGGNGAGTSQCTTTCRWKNAAPACVADAACTGAASTGTNCAGNTGKCQMVAGVSCCLP